jgi:hypothetical protein
MDVRLSECHKRRLTRSLHGRWPYRRAHSRHDHHWLVRVQAPETWCPGARNHSLTALRECSRRP